MNFNNPAKKIRIFTLLICSFFFEKIYSQLSPELSWAKNFGGSTASISSNKIHKDISGNIYTTGSFSNTVDFDPSASVQNMTSNGNNDIYVTKLDASGNLAWSKSIGGTGADNGYSVISDLSGNVYVFGDFTGTVDFDPNAGTYNLTSNGQGDIFMLKLDMNGNFVWAKSVGGTNAEWALDMMLDESSNKVFYTGSFSGTVDFDPSASLSNLTSAGSDDVYLLALDLSGNFVWAKAFGGTGSEFGEEVDIDNTGNIYLTGSFNGTADFDPGAGISNLVTSAGSSYIVKLDNSGNFVWAKGFQGTGNNFSNGMCVEKTTSAVYVIGNYSGTVDFDPNAAVSNLTAAGTGDIFITKLDGSGNLVFAKDFKGAGSHYGACVKYDGNGNIYACGNFNGTLDFDPSLTTYTISSSADDGFIAKLDLSGSLLWVNTISGAASDGCLSMIVDANDIIYSTGKFSGSIDFDPSPSVSNLTSTGSTDTYVLKWIQCSPLTVNPTNASVCSGTSLTLTANGSSTYTWSTGATTPSIIFNAISSSVYTVTGTTAAGCSKTNTVNVGVNAPKTISGSIVGATSGNVVLYKYTPTLSKWDSVTFAPFTSTYSFGAVDSSYYVIKAIPTATNMQITYYPSEVSWQNAGVITHGCFTGSTNTITVKPFASIGTGSGLLTGQIIEGNGFGQRPDGSSFKPMIPGNPIGGIVVKGGRNPGGLMFTSTTTDPVTGTYTISGLPDNTVGVDEYFILVDIPGLDTNLTYHRTLVAGNNQLTNLDFIVDSMFVNPINNSVGIHDINAIENQLEIYPNPASNFININYRLSNTSSINISVMDLLGKSVKILQEDTFKNSGYYKQSFAINDLKNGIYFMKVKINDHVSIVKLVVSN